MTERRVELAEIMAELDRLFEEMIVPQRAKVLRVAREHAPTVTPDDVMNPHDIAGLTDAPIFHFEDGLLSGLISARIAVRAGLRRRLDEA